MKSFAIILHQLPTHQRLHGLLVLLAVPIAMIAPWLAAVIVLAALAAGMTKPGVSLQGDGATDTQRREEADDGRPNSL